MEPRVCPKHGYALPGEGCLVCRSEVRTQREIAEATKVSSCDHCYCEQSYDNSHKICCNCGNKQKAF